MLTLDLRLKLINKLLVRYGPYELDGLPFMAAEELKHLSEQVANTERAGYALKAAISQQINKLMFEEGVTNAELAQRMETSCLSVDRLLEPYHSGLTLGNLKCAAEALGAKVTIIIEKEKKAEQSKATSTQTSKGEQ